MKPFARVALVLLGAAVATGIIFFCLGNRQLVTVDLLKWETDAIPLWAVVVTAFAVGFCLPAGVLVAFAVKASWRSMRQRKTIRALKMELNALRNLPLAEPDRPDVGAELPQAVLAASVDHGPPERDEALAIGAGAGSANEPSAAGPHHRGGIGTSEGQAASIEGVAEGVAQEGVAARRRSL